MKPARWQVPVMVETSAPIDSDEAARFLQEHLHGKLPCPECCLVSVDGVPADPEDPNSPPVPAERLMSL